MSEIEFHAVVKNTIAARTIKIEPVIKIQVFFCSNSDTYTFVDFLTELVAKEL